MKKEQLIAAAVVVVLALGAAFLGRTSGKLEDASARTVSALKTRTVPVIVVTTGRSGASGEFLRGVKQALAGQKRVALVHLDTQDPVEREAKERYTGKTLPLVAVIGLDGEATYEQSTQVEAEAIRAAIAEGLTKPPIKIEEGGHHH
jgi:hypothetical protein